MKKYSRKKRDRDIWNSFRHRTSQSKKTKRKIKKEAAVNGVSNSRWLDYLIDKGLNVVKLRSNSLEIFLPKKMNFSDSYDETILYINALRRLAKNSNSRNGGYQIRHVHFNNLKQISTSAALVLTAELSLWQDQLPTNLTPNIATWHPDILSRFSELGFFDLFKSHQNDPAHDSPRDSNVRLVRYIKGSCHNKDHGLRQKVLAIVGKEKIKKWPILSGGLDEAITNVGHHAYPEDYEINVRDKNWYLTGAFREDTQEMKIVFYDQGIGIPKSLPSSKHWERLTEFLSNLGLGIGANIGNRLHHANLIKGAMEISRTSTGQGDRGKGLQDLLNFIRERGQGYLSVISGHGLYKFEIANDRERSKTEHFSMPVLGTLIIWKVKLGEET